MAQTFHKGKSTVATDNFFMSFDEGTALTGRYPDYGDSTQPVAGRIFKAQTDLAGTVLTGSKMTVDQIGTSTVVTQYDLVNLTTTTVVATVTVLAGANTSGTIAVFGGTITVGDELYWEIVTGDTAVAANLNFAFTAA